MGSDIAGDMLMADADAWEDARVWEGILSLLDEYAEVRAEDVAIVAYTSDSREAAAWVSVALATRGIDTRRVWMSPLQDEGFLERFRSALTSPADLTGRLLVFTFERDTMSHGRALRRALSEQDESRCVVIRAISACPALFSNTLRVGPSDLSARNTAILERGMIAKTLRIETASGTALSVTLDNERYKWVSNRGVWSPGRFLILPAGEVATFPASIDGILVADFAYNVNVITDRDARLHNHPVAVVVEGGRAAYYECDDSELSQFLEQCFETPNARNVGEVGFGTNWGVESAIPLNSHINERRPGVHLGFGDHNQYDNVAGYSCPLHIDLIAKGGRVWIDDDPVPIDLENVVPSAGAHPTRFRDDDVKSPEDDLDMDCCGVLDGGRIRRVLVTGA